MCLFLFWYQKQKLLHKNYNFKCYWIDGWTSIYLLSVRLDLFRFCFILYFVFQMQMIEGKKVYLWIELMSSYGLFSLCHRVQLLLWNCFGFLSRLGDVSGASVSLPMQFYASNAALICVFFFFFFRYILARPKCVAIEKLIFFFTTISISRFNSFEHFSRCWFGIWFGVVFNACHFKLNDDYLIIIHFKMFWKCSF